MNKQELINEITKTKEHLANMEKMLAECECERWRPCSGEEFYLIDCNLEIQYYTWYNCDLFKETYLNYGCFQTYKEAEAEAEKILVRRILEDIARRLNKGEKIDWNSYNQEKYWLSYDFVENRICMRSNRVIKEEGATYCLSSRFKDVAIQEIGEERLKKYLRGE